jgi:hypothetical protein
VPLKYTHHACDTIESAHKPPRVHRRGTPSNAAQPGNGEPHDKLACNILAAIMFVAVLYHIKL